MDTYAIGQTVGKTIKYGAAVAIAVGIIAACSGKKEEAKAAVAPTAVVSTAPVVEAPKVDPVELVKGWTWGNDSGMFLKLANVKIKNNTNQDIKDPTIYCNAYGESGTRIDSNRRDQFKIIKAGETITLGSVDMGFLRSQADTVGCTVSAYKKIGE